MNIASFCQRDVVTIEADASLRDAAGAMRERHVGALVVTDATAPSRVAGVVTDRDLAIEVLARDLDAGSIRIGQLVRRAPVSVPGDGSLREAVAAMEQAGVRRLLVTGDDGRVIGFLSADDLVQALAAEVAGLARALRSGMERETAERPSATPPDDDAVFLPLGMLGMH
ncbi:CBS domain-containing protein [Ramlibacter sp.]|uniref:CBS domain-containing protein n=1 Tax=Ramlibacter sp. TaxID=1917967 RepID=UPI002BFC1169|nr:CBS domain-containing protein [Ramlibacter sp.]HWI81144.1 CBS domain-containing protein [Ramlibacter sp.]